MKKIGLKKVHFVGIGGIGMSALAKHLLRYGIIVSGSDRQENEETAKLRKMGARVFVPHAAENATGADIVVRTTAVPESNCEVAFAKQHNIPVLLREELLGGIFDAFRERIAVCGTHGKTTVTAMIHHMLERCGVSHTAFIGGEYQNKNYFCCGGFENVKSAEISKNDDEQNSVVVAEACEYNRSFLHLHPTLCVCLNVEFDHPDCYENLDDVHEAFGKLFSQSQTTVINSHYKQLCPSGILFGAQGVRAENITLQNGCAHFDIFVDDDFVAPCKLKVFGEHNINNALAAIAVAKYLRLPLLQAAQALETFEGVGRRWGKIDCALDVVCDYAHHPTEIQTTVKTAKSLSGGRIICVFQPHTYTRTLAFFNEFVSCFDGADEVVYLPVFSAREKPLKNVSSFQLFKRAKSVGKNAKYFADFEKAAKYLKRVATPSDLVVLVGAGDVVKLADYLQD